MLGLEAVVQPASRRMARPSPQVPAMLRHSRAVVRIAERRPEPAFPEPRRTVGHAATVWPGIRGSDLKRAVEPVDSAAVLELRCGACDAFYAAALTCALLPGGGVLSGSVAHACILPPVRGACLCCPCSLDLLLVPADPGPTAAAGAWCPASWGGGTRSRPPPPPPLTSPLSRWRKGRSGGEDGVAALCRSGPGGGAGRGAGKDHACHAAQHIALACNHPGPSLHPDAPLQLFCVGRRRCRLHLSRLCEAAAAGRQGVWLGARVQAEQRRELALKVACQHTFLEPPCSAAC